MCRKCHPPVPEAEQHWQVGATVAQIQVVLELVTADGTAPDTAP